MPTPSRKLMPMIQSQRPANMVRNSAATLKPLCLGKPWTRLWPKAYLNGHRLQTPDILALSILAAAPETPRTLAIAHAAHDKAVLDAVREVRPPFSPENVVSEFATLLKSYAITTIRGSRSPENGRASNSPSVASAIAHPTKPSLELYLDLLPVINSGRVSLLDHPKLVSQLCALERRTARSGRDSMNSPPNAHEDLANCVAGAIDLAQPRVEREFVLGLGPKIYRDGQELVSGSGLQRIDHEFPDYGRRLWEAQVIR